MGKRIRAQRRGRGGIFEANTHKSKAPNIMPTFDVEKEGTVLDIIHNPGRGTPLAKLKLTDGQLLNIAAPEGLILGQTIHINNPNSLNIGNILSLKNIPPGTQICNIELQPGDGGTFARSSGSFAQIIGETSSGIELKLPSGKSKSINPNCKAVIGIVAGAGRVDKPFLKMGTKVHLFKAKGAKRIPLVRGKAMNPVDHPFGGGAHQHAGKSKNVRRDASPGRKVGSFGGKRSGRKR